MIDSDISKQFTIAVPANEDVNLHNFIDDYFGVGCMAILIAGYDKNFKKKIIFNTWNDKFVFNKGQIIYAYVAPVAHISNLLTQKYIIYGWLTLSLNYIKEDNRPFIYDYINLYTYLDTQSNGKFYATWGDSISYDGHYQYGLFLPCSNFLNHERLVGIVTASGAQYVIARVEADNSNGVTFIERKAKREYRCDKIRGVHFKSIYQNTIQMKK